MTGAEFIGPVIGAASKAAQSGGGKGGGQSANQASPEQAALAQYHYGENLLAAESGYAGTGTGHSTMETQATGGARNQRAKELAGAADQNLQLANQANTQLQQLAQQNQLISQANQAGLQDRSTMMPTIDSLLNSQGYTPQQRSATLRSKASAPRTRRSTRSASAPPIAWPPRTTAPVMAT